MTECATWVQDDDYAKFCKFLQSYCGLRFAPNRRTDLELGIRRAYAASTCANFEEYCSLLFDSEDGAIEIDRLVNAVTVNESHFFRNSALFNALYYCVFPKIIKQKRQMRTLRIWSAGCASGEEPYSLAILLRELLPDIDDWSITILGTDINTEALDRARRGIYGPWAFREEHARQMQARYFRAGDSSYELLPAVRNMVTFARLNLAQNNYPSYDTNTTAMDLILCRNVMIYFDSELSDQVVNRLYEALVDGGWLMVGYSEHSIRTCCRFQAQSFPNIVLYQRNPNLTIWQPDSQGLSFWPPEQKPIQSPDPGIKFTAPPPKQQDMLEQARQHLSLGRSEQAQEVLLALIEAEFDFESIDQLHEPSRLRFALVCALLGQACANLGFWQEAERWCCCAVQWDPLLFEAYHALALVYQHQGQLDSAIDAMKKAVYIDHKSVLGHFGLANLYYNNDQLSRAQKSLDNAQRLLRRFSPDQVIPESGGVTAGRLREAIARQQQRCQTLE